MVRPRVVITPGDPAGIGPEIVEKILTRPSIYKKILPIVIGDRRLFPRLARAGKKLSAVFVDLPYPELEKLIPGKYSSATGKYSYEATLRAVELIEAGRGDALVTAPVSKAAMYLAGVHYPGQTELIADVTGTKNYAMLMAAGGIVSAMVTRHVAVTDVSKNISVNKITDLVQLLDRFLREAFRIKYPRICVAALNPHAGENGLLGKEEKLVISPAVSFLKENGLNVNGPLPCDSAWVKIKKKEFDALVTMYHDQTMIALKCLSPEKIVNITAGLPFIRTSPGHGTAFDIAGKNAADPRPMFEAVLTAARLSMNLI
jgi:4-hydroxythreonine-4-phosphate dehydrogenase